MQKRRTSLLAAVVASALCAAPGAAQEKTGMKLEDAGFIMREANTPQKMERLRALPPDQFVARTQNGVRYYVYADPQYCKCAYVGGQEALQAFRDMRKAAGYGLPGYDPNANPGLQAGGDNVENDMIRDMNEDGGAPYDGEDILNPNF